MATLHPFRALRPAPAAAPAVAAVPYDVINADEARTLAAGKPLSFLHVSRAELGLPASTDPYSDVVYDTARQNFDRLKSAAPLVVDDAPSVYFYRLRMGSHVQTGLAACYSLDEYDGDVIRKHEKTRKDKEDDRTRHMLELGAQTGPVFLTYTAAPEIDALAASATAGSPLYDFTAEDGVQHTIWRVSGDTAAALVSAMGRVPTQIDYSDYRDVAGVKMPYKWSYAWLSGREEFSLTEIQPNVAIDAAKFAKPVPVSRAIR